MLKLSIVVTFGKKTSLKKVKIMYCLSCKDITLVPMCKDSFYGQRKICFLSLFNSRGRKSERDILCVCVFEREREEESKYLVPLSNKNSE